MSLFSDHPDAGTTLYAYDNAGNLLRETTPLGSIAYKYRYRRLLRKRYDSMTGNDVEYTYGTAGNDMGRVVMVTDGSGALERHYDAMGNVVDETRTIAVPQNDNTVYRFRTLYSYDSWGRAPSITYPDGERVEYDYKWGGNLHSMRGMASGDTHTLIGAIWYNAMGLSHAHNNITTIVSL